jgi:hypothetical protein
LDVLKSADISKIDRRETKSVRLLFEITPQFLDAARPVSPTASGSAPDKPLPGQAGPRKRDIPKKIDEGKSRAKEFQSPAGVDFM